MAPVEDFKAIENTRVALRVDEEEKTEGETIVRDGRRNLASINEQPTRRNLQRGWEWNENENGVPELMLTT